MSMRKPSPARSQGLAVRPQRKYRRTNSTNSPGPSNTSGRLGDSFKLSLLSKRSVLNDDTNIEEPRQRSWWKRLEQSSRDMDLPTDNNDADLNNIFDDSDVEVMSEENYNATMNLPESSGTESIKSIVIPQRKLFTEKENMQKKLFSQFGTRETLPKLHKTNNTVGDQTVYVAPKQLFQKQSRPKHIFTAALLDISRDKTTREHTLAAVEPTKQVRNLFSSRPGTNRNNMFANFLVSESEDELFEPPEIPQPRIFTFKKNTDFKRRPSSSSRGFRDPSPTSSLATDTEFDDWKMLPSSTMVDNQLEAMMIQAPSPKIARLSKLSEAKESIARTSSSASYKTKKNKSTSSKSEPKFISKEKAMTALVDNDEDEMNFTLQYEDDNAPEEVEVAKKTIQRDQSINETIRKTNDSRNSSQKEIKLRESRNSNRTNRSFQNTLINKSIEDSPIPQMPILNTSDKKVRNSNSITKSIQNTESNNILSTIHKVSEITHNKIIISNINDSIDNVLTIQESISKDGGVHKEHEHDEIEIGNDEKTRDKHNEQEINEIKDKAIKETQEIHHTISQIEPEQQDKGNDKDNNESEVKEAKKGKNDLIKISQYEPEVQQTNQAGNKKTNNNGQKEMENTEDENKVTEKNNSHSNKLVEFNEQECQSVENKAKFEEIKSGHQNISLIKAHQNEEDNMQLHNKNNETKQEIVTDNNEEGQQNRSQDADQNEYQTEHEENNETSEIEEENVQEILNDADNSDIEEAEDEQQNISQEVDQIENETEDEENNESNENEQEIVNDEDNSDIEESADDQLDVSNKETKQNEDDETDVEENNESKEIENVHAQETVRDKNEKEQIQIELNISQESEMENNESMGNNDCVEDNEQEFNSDVDEVDKGSNVDEEENEITDNEQQNVSQDEMKQGEEDEMEQGEEDEMEQGEEDEMEQGDGDEMEVGVNNETNESAENNDQEINSEDNETENEESDDEQLNDSQEEISQNDEEEMEIEENNESNESIQDNVQESNSYVDESENENTEDEQQNISQEETNEEQHDENADTPNTLHRTNINSMKDGSPDMILLDKTNQFNSFAPQGRNTSVRKTKSLAKAPNTILRQSLAPGRESTGLSDRASSSSAEGSGWDSHRTTRKTLRQTFGKDFTPRKSLRAMVMEKYAHRQTMENEMTSVTAKFPQANSTELTEESTHNVNDNASKVTLQEFFERIRQRNSEEKARIDEEVRNSLMPPPRNSPYQFKVPEKPKFFRSKVTKPVKPKPKAPPPKSFIRLADLPLEVRDDMKYKPPKRFKPGDAAWITNRLYKFLETKLQPKYDYKSRVRAEKLVERLYSFTKAVRRLQGNAPADTVTSLKREMARLDIVQTHFEFNDFFYEFMPREVRIKVVPDVVNRIPGPRNGVFSDILTGNTETYE